MSILNDLLAGKALNLQEVAPSATGIIDNITIDVEHGGTAHEKRTVRWSDKGKVGTGLKAANDHAASVESYKKLGVTLPEDYLGKIEGLGVNAHHELHTVTQQGQDALKEIEKLRKDIVSKANPGVNDKEIKAAIEALNKHEAELKQLTTEVNGLVAKAHTEVTAATAVPPKPGSTPTTTPTSGGTPAATENSIGKAMTYKEVSGASGKGELGKLLQEKATAAGRTVENTEAALMQEFNQMSLPKRTMAKFQGKWNFTNELHDGKYQARTTVGKGFVAAETGLGGILLGSGIADGVNVVGRLVGAFQPQKDESGVEIQATAGDLIMPAVKTGSGVALLAHVLKDGSKLALGRH